jgi:hypothetical protein
MTPENFLDRRENAARHPIGKLRPVPLKTPRKLDAVDAVVLHSMGFEWSQYGIGIYDKVDAHFVVLRSGKAVHLHDISVYLNASAGFNRRGIAIEFEGNPISDRGVAFEEAKFGRHAPTLSQIFAGRGLVQTLKEQHKISFVFAHRQSEGKGGVRGNCPGPEIWYNVGEWAKSQLGLSDGGPGFAIQGGTPIPQTWRERSNDLTLEDMFRS